MNYFTLPGLSRDSRIWETISCREAAQIIETVTTHFQVSYEKMIKKTRVREIIIVRHFAIYFLRRRTALTLNAISDITGGQDHTTILHAINTINDLIKVDPYYRDHKAELTAKLNQYKSPIVTPG